MSLPGFLGLAILVLCAMYVTFSPNPSLPDNEACFLLCRGAKAKHYQASAMYGCVCYDPMPAFVIARPRGSAP